MTEPTRRNGNFGWTILAAIVSGLIGLVIGGLLGNQQIYHNIREVNSDTAQKIIDSNPDFAGLTIFFPNVTGDFQFVGSVPSEEAKAKLKEAIINEFGKLDLDIRMITVHLAPKSAEPKILPDHPVNTRNDGLRL